MNVSDQLLDKYFKNKCTPEEKLLVENYLREIDELPDYLAQKEEWDNAVDFPISYEKSDLMFETIKKQTFGKKQKRLWFKISTIAAAILVVLSITFFYLQESSPGQLISKTAPQKIERANKITWKSIVNYTDQVQAFILPDQSIVKIYPGAEIRYALPFISNKREIFLEGKSFFQVTKDKKHPFVVYAKGVSTTALGTSFTITANTKSKLIQVQLHTGKVWVKDIDSTRKSSTFSKILLPGDALVFNRTEQALQIDKPINTIAKAEVRQEISFSQAPLTEVFAKLAQHYKTKITYTASDLEEMSFTGTLNLDQPIHKVLKEITELNKLNQEKIANGFLIKQ
jgi:transmembrane sensor